MALILGIDTSSVDLGVALTGDAMPVASFSRFQRHSHAEHIAQAVSMLLQTAGAEPAHVERVAVVVGPGSFTGLRIGISFVKGFCFGRTVKVLPVSSLETAAQGGIGCANRRIIAAIDARRDEVFWAPFERREGALGRLGPDIISSAGDFRDQIRSDDVLITDTMGYDRSTVFNFLSGRPDTYPVERYPLHRGLACAQIAASALGHPALWLDAIDILPNYLRASAAQVAKGG